MSKAQRNSLQNRLRFILNLYTSKDSLPKSEPHNTVELSRIFRTVFEVELKEKDFDIISSVLLSGKDDLRSFDTLPEIPCERRENLARFLFTFKTEPCSLAQKIHHEEATCHFYHNLKTRRRNLIHFRYLPIPCEAVLTVNAELKDINSWRSPELCVRGDSCSKAHTLNELFYHPETYKRMICKKEKETASEKSICPFAHSMFEKDEVSVWFNAPELSLSIDKEDSHNKLNDTKNLTSSEKTQCEEGLSESAEEEMVDIENLKRELEIVTSEINKLQFNEDFIRSSRVDDSSSDNSDEKDPNKMMPFVRAQPKIRGLKKDNFKIYKTKKSDEKSKTSFNKGDLESKEGNNINTEFSNIKINESNEKDKSENIDFLFNKNKYDNKFDTFGTNPFDDTQNKQNKDNGINKHQENNRNGGHFEPEKDKEDEGMMEGKEANDFLIDTPFGEANGTKDNPQAQEIFEEEKGKGKTDNFTMSIFNQDMFLQMTNKYKKKSKGVYGKGMRKKIRRVRMRGDLMRRNNTIFVRGEGLQLVLETLSSLEEVDFGFLDLIGADEALRTRFSCQNCIERDPMYCIIDCGHLVCVPCAYRLQGYSCIVCSKRFKRLQIFQLF